MRLATLIPVLPLATAIGPSQEPLLANSRSKFFSDDSSPPWRDELLRLHRGLIEAESISGAEGPASSFIFNYLSARGYTLVRQFVPPVSSQDENNFSILSAASLTSPASPLSSDQPPVRYNVVAWPSSKEPLKSDSSARTGPSPRVIVTSHIDVVPPYIPYAISDEPPTRHSCISGRGSVDAKASVAAQVVAVENLISSGRIDPIDVMLLFVVGEEVSGDGMITFSESMAAFDPPLAPEAVIFGEPTENKLACGHKGMLFGSITAYGVTGHSGYPWLGRSATEVLVRALAQITDADLGTSDLYGNTTVNIGKLTGGIASNVIAPLARADLGIRVAFATEDGGHEEVRRRIEKILKNVQGDNGDRVFETNFRGYGLIKCECDLEGFETMVANYGTDVPHLKGEHKKYLYGPGGILVAHSDHEKLKVEDLEEAVEGFEKLVLHALS